MPTRMERRQERVQRCRREALAWIIELTVVFVLAMLVRTYVFSLTSVQGPSLLETLHSNQVVAVDKLYYRLNRFARGQVVICRYPNSSEYYVKRIIALPGETLEICGGKTLINGQELEEGYVRYAAQEDFGPVSVGKDEVFVMGDNRANSYDSRQEGALDANMIVGRVVAVCLPVWEARWLPEHIAD